MDLTTARDVFKEDELLEQLWNKLVHPGITSLEIAKAHVEELKPPTEEDIEELIESSEVQSIIETREALEAAEKEAETLRAQLDTWARETLSVSVSADEKATATQTLNREKSKVKTNLEAMRLQAENEGLTTSLELIDSLLKELFPAPVSRSSKTNLMEMRKWLQEHDYKVSDRGRIPEELQKIYYAAQG